MPRRQERFLPIPRFDNNPERIRVDSNEAGRRSGAA
jgi:hypothetical protein